MNPIIYIIIFIAATLVGYKLIKNVPSLLHTPLMSSMNALSGITLLGALAAASSAVHMGNKILGYTAILLAMINVAAGFFITHKMLAMFRQRTEDR